MNIAHPFREGYGRAMRIWLDHMLSCGFGVVVDWSRIDKDEYLQAMGRSPFDDSKIHNLLENALTDQIDDPEIFMSGLDASFWFEGFNQYRCFELIE